MAYKWGKVRQNVAGKFRAGEHIQTFVCMNISSGRVVSAVMGWREAVELASGLNLKMGKVMFEVKPWDN